MSGVTVDQKCVEEWNKQKLKKAYKFVVYKLNDDNTEVVVETTSTDESYDAFLDALPENECRYATLDVKNPKPNLSDKLVFLLWAPDTANVKSKMVYASSKDVVTKKLEGIAKVIQANDRSEVQLTAIIDKI